MVDDPNSPISTDPVTATTSAVTALTDALKAAGISTDAINQIVGKVIDSFSKMTSATKDVTQSFSAFDSISKLTGTSIGELGTSADGTSNFLDRLKNMSLQSANAFNMVGAALMGSSELLKSIGSDKSMTTLSKSIAQVVNDSRGLAGPLGAMVDMLGVNLTKVIGGQIITKSLEEIRREVTNLGGAIDQHLNMERAVFNMTTQTGQVNTLFGSTGVTLSTLSDVARKYEESLNNIATATHSDREATGSYFEALRKLPPMYKDNSDAATITTNQMKQLQQNITLAHGSGQTFNDVLSQSKTLLDTFNMTGKNVNEITVEGAELTKNFGVNIADTTGFLTQMANTFQMLGDNTEGVTAIFGSFFNGLRDGGLGIKPAIETIKQMGESLAHLSIAQKAFISGRTGGPGGLLGGIELERDLAAGKSAEVMERLRKSFTQSLPGGQVINRDQVNDQASASQYEAQVRKLQSSAFGNIAKSDEQAAAILKAFSSGKPIDTKTANDALAGVMKTGTDYQKLSYTRVDHIAATLDQIAVHGGTAAADIVQKGLTQVGASGKETTGLQGITADAMARVARVETPGDKSQQYSNEALTGGIRDLHDVMSSSIPSLSDAAKRALSSPTGATDPANARAFNQLEAQRADFQRMLKGGTMSKDNYAAQIGAIDTYEKMHSLAPDATKSKMVGQAAQMATGMHAGGRQTPHAPQPPTAHTTSVSGPEKLAATINVYIDGKKIHQSSQQAALGPTKDVGAGH